MATKKPPMKARGIIPLSKLPDYGMVPPESCRSLLLQELYFFRQEWGSQQPTRIKATGRMLNTNPKGRPRWVHFVNAVNLIWNYQGTSRPFDWHPWALQMLKAACKRKRLGIAGAGSTGKSDFFAVWAIINWACNPCGRSIQLPDGTTTRKEGCMVLVTSTTKSAASNRIWGKVVAYWNSMIAPMPGKLISSEHVICYWNPSTGETDRNSGIKLVAGEASKAAQSADDIRGIKGDPVIVIADEMPELGHSLVNTFDENLSNNYNHQLIGLGNPATYFDPHGAMCEPVGGWDSVGLDDYEWEAVKGGHVLRLNSELSPNIIDGEPGGKPRYPYLMRSDQLENQTKVLGGRHTLAYHRGILGMWHRDGDEETIYSQGELMASKASEKATWLGEKTAVGACDPSFSSEGDRTIFSLGHIGTSVDNKLILEYGGATEVHADTRNKDVPHMVQIARRIVALCREHGVSPKNFAIDASGPGGKAFRDILITEWTNDFLCVEFGGAPSDRPVSNLDPTPCNKRYDRRVSEVWFGGKALLRTDQLRGVDRELATELVIRKYRQTKPTSADNRIIVETKREMRNRTQRSPDIGDGFMVLCELGRVRHKLIPYEKPADRKGGKGKASNPVVKKFRALAECYAA